MEVVGGGGGSRSCILETVDCVEDDRATTITADGEGGGGGVGSARRTGHYDGVNSIRSSSRQAAG